MWDPVFRDDLQNYNEFSESSPQVGAQEQPWFKTIFNTVKKYKKNLFGESDSSIYIKRQRTLDYTIPPNYKFVLAKYDDGLYRTASIVGSSKKMQLFTICFYQNNKCCYVKSRDVIIRHGNLLDMTVCFCHQGQAKKGKVYGNNSPANHGFPSIFYIRKHGKWFKISYRNIFLTRKQISKIYFATPRRRSTNSVHSRSSVRSSKFNL